MFVRYQDVAALAFNNEKNVSRKAVFFSRQDPYYYTQCTNFRTIFQDLIFKLKIIRPEILQSTDTFLNFKKERKKIEVMEKAIKMSNILLEDYKKELFIDKIAPLPALSHYFYIRGKAKELFIKQILLPLLNLVNNIDTNNWVKMRGKRGLWRELKKDEMMPIGGEVSMNLTTGIKMLRL